MTEGLRLGRFYCQDRLGATGPIETWRARLYGLAGLDRPFSVKRLRPGAEAALCARFLDAARLASAIEDRRLARIVEVSEGAGEGPFVAAEFVHGVDLRELLDAARSVGMPAIPVDATAFVGARTAEALAVAHGGRHPLPHGGLGPGNVIVTARGEVRLLDVATAGALRAAPSDSQAGIDLPRWRYAAPELLAGEGPTAASDLFALGALLFEMVTGAPAFAVADSITDLREAMKSPPLAPVTPEYLGRIIQGLLDFDPRERGDSAADVAARLDAMLPPRSPFADVGRNLVELVAAARRRAPVLRSEAAGEPLSIVAEPSQSRPEPPPAVPEPAPLPFARTQSSEMAEARERPPAALSPAFPPPPSAELPVVASEAPPLAGAVPAAAPTHAPSPVPAPAPAVPEPPDESFAGEPTRQDAVAGFIPAPTQADAEYPVDDDELELVYEPPPLPGREPPPPRMAPDATRPSVPVPMAGPGSPGASSLAPAVIPSFDPDGPLARTADPAPEQVAAEITARQTAAQRAVARSMSGIARYEAPAGRSRRTLVLLIALAGSAAAAGGYAVRARHGTHPVPPPKPVPVVVRAAGAPSADPSPAPPPRAVAGLIVVRSTPVAATVWIDGEEKGPTPLSAKVAPGKHRLAVIAAGHAMWRKSAEDGAALDADLAPIEPPLPGPAGLKVRCRTEGRFPVLVDGKETGLLCPTERIGLPAGDHEVGLYVPADDKAHNRTESFEESGSSKRVYFRF